MKVHPSSCIVLGMFVVMLLWIVLGTRRRLDESRVAPEFQVLKNLTKASGATEAYLTCSARMRGTDYYCNAVIYRDRERSSGYGSSPQEAVEVVIKKYSGDIGKPNGEDLDYKWHKD